MSILNEILEEKQRELTLALSRCSIEDLKVQATRYAPLGFLSKLFTSPYPAVIAEVKRASPSKGIIRADLDPVAVAQSYYNAHAACLSVLTDEKYFKGHADILKSIRLKIPSIPILRKDFTIHAYNIWEARAWGADAILLIVAALQRESLSSLLGVAYEANLDVIVEVHDEVELSLALDVIEKHPETHCALGINNRNLHTFETSLSVTEELARVAFSRNPKLSIISESGIVSYEDIKALSAFGSHAFLVGESLLRTGNPEENLKRLRNNH